MNELPDDPVYLSSRREAVVTIVAWAVCGLYTVTYCYLTGYGIEAEEIPTVWGIPNWLFFGVFLPWILVQGFAWWFCFRFVKDQELGEEPEDGETSEEGRPHGS